VAFRAVGRVAPTKGFLIKLRRRVEFFKMGAETLEMKRDKLIKELSALQGRLIERKELDKEIMGIYETLKVAYAIAGVEEMRKAALLSQPFLIKVKTTSLMGVEIPEAEIVQKGFKPSPSIQVPLISALDGLQRMMDRLINVVMLEAALERLAIEVADTMRRVNTLRKVIIPEHERAIKYIEERLEEESLEDFLRIKKYRMLKRGV